MKDPEKYNSEVIFRDKVKINLELEEIEKTYNELDKKLADPAVYGDQEQLKKVSKSKK